MVEFEVIHSEEVKIGSNNFIEVARKKAVSEDGEREFLSISRGFYLFDGTKKWRSSISIPDDDEIRKQLAELIKTI